MKTITVWQTLAWRDQGAQGPITVHLRWTERSAATAKGRWQVTMLEPPASITNWEHPPGLVASGEVGQLPATGELDVSFAPTVPGPEGQRLEQGGQSPDAPRMARIARAVLGAPLLEPRRFFVRIVGLDGQGKPAGPPSNAIIIDWTPPLKKFWSPEEIQKLNEERQKLEAAAVRARLSLTSFEPYQAEKPDAHYHYIVTRDVKLLWTTYKKGQEITLKPKKKNWLDDVGDALGDAASFIQDSVNWVSHGWKDIKAFAIDTVADRIPGCETTCRTGLAAGLDAGLAAMGMPPSIPNFDQLAQAGKGYLVQTLAEQASETVGYQVPPQAVEAVVDRMYAAASEHADGAHSGGWLRPDPDFMYKPPIAQVRVVSQSASVLRDLVLTVVFYRLYYGKAVPLPPIAPGGTIDVPIVLDQPMFEEWAWSLAREHGMAAQLESNVHSAWQNSHDHEKNTLIVMLTKNGEPGRTLVSTCPTFVAAEGFSG
jgi:hypothetical protein